MRTFQKPECLLKRLQFYSICQVEFIVGSCEFCLELGVKCPQSKFVHGIFQMLGTTVDMDVGGLWLDDIIREKFRQEFITKYGKYFRVSDKRLKYITATNCKQCKIKIF